MPGFDRESGPASLRYQGRPASLDVRGQQRELFPFDAFVYDQDQKLIGLKLPWAFILTDSEGNPVDLGQIGETLQQITEALVDKADKDEVRIIEDEGVIGDVSYVKYNDGEMVLRKEVLIGPLAYTTEGIFVASTLDSDISETYPFPFVGTPPLLIVRFRHMGANVISQTLTGFVSNATRLFSAMPSEGPAYFGYYAIGKWK